MALRQRTIQVDSATLKKAIADLDKLAPKKQPLREVVEQLKPSLVGALNKGYSYEELSDFLKDRGIFIAPGTIKQYLTAGSSKRKEEASSHQADEELRTQEKSATEKDKVVAVDESATPTKKGESKKDSASPALDSTEAPGTKKPSSKEKVEAASRAAVNPKFVSISDEDL